ncbi:MAG: 50S ribosomal protein L11 methyltransferase [Nitrospirota bacterium]|nr:50S ribosomal protein L11 methyltransferase [Nitrospirota bacterium]
MTYIEIIVTASEESRDALISKMSEMGAIGFVEQDEGVIGYFEPKQSPAEICDELGRFKPLLEASGLDASFSLTHNVLPEKDWNETWKKNFTPIDVGDNLTIIPSWLQSATNRIPIIIDPGMVFGTGHHETTRTCLCMIEKIARSGSKKSFLDIGTGTGILAIGAARLGFEQVIALDIDPLAVDAAQRNAEANSLNNIEVLEGTIGAVNSRFDLIAANLLVEILIGIAPELSDRLQPGGRAILSGLLIGQENSVIEAMASSGLHLQEKIIDGKWVSLVMTKQQKRL